MNILIHDSIRYDSLRFEECVAEQPSLAVGPAPGVVAVASTEPRLVLLTVAMVTDHSRRWRRSRRGWPIKQIPQIVLQLQVRARPPRHSLNGQIRPPVTNDGSSGHRVASPSSSAVGFVLNVELAQGVHQGAVLVLPALLQQRLGRNVVQIVCAGVLFIGRSEIKSIF